MKSIKYGTEQNASIMMSSPSSIFLLISISSSLVSSGICPISRRYIRTGLSERLHSKSSTSLDRSNSSSQPSSSSFFCVASLSFASSKFLILEISAAEISSTSNFFVSASTFLTAVAVGALSKNFISLS